MRKNGMTILALALCLLSLVLTALVWLKADQASRDQELRLTQLENRVETLEAKLEKVDLGIQLELQEYTLTAKAWPDAAGADVTLRAVPEIYEESREVVFLTESSQDSGATAREVLCQWDGTAYTATVSLPAASLYTYYLGTGDDNWITLAGAWGDKALECVYLADSLAGYVTFELESWSADQGLLTLHRGDGIAQLPLIGVQGTGLTASSCELRLKLGEETVSAVPIQPTAGEGEGSLELLTEELALQVPELEEEQLVELWLEVEMSDGRRLSTWVCGWVLTDGQLGQVAG